MIDFFSANLERKRVKIRVKGTVAETYGAIGHHSSRLIKQIGIAIGAVREENISFSPSKVYQWPYNKAILLVSSERYQN